MPIDKTEEQSVAGKITARVDGAGASAQGPGATAAGAGGVAARDIHGNVQITNTLADTTVASEQALRAAYLNVVKERCGYLSLEGIDPTVASQRGADTQLNLNAVYTALLTRSPKEREEGLKPGGLPRQAPEESLRSALEQLDRYPRLVLQGDPGSGKSTFVNFVALCLAGEALGDSQINLQLLTTPLPDEDGSDGQEPQPWRYGALLPVPVILRDLAATGLPAPDVTATAQHLWNFIATELERADLGEYAPLLRKELLERGGLLLLDGLDEVPEAEQRRQQVKQAVEGFAGSYKNCRILVTSRTYAYQKQDWRLKGFAETVLAPFSDGQIRRFITRWYGHTAGLGRLGQQDAAGRAELLKQAIFNRPTFYELAQRPLLLALMVSLHAWRGGNLPEKREALYADTVDLLLNRWEQRLIKRDAQGQYQLLQPSLAEYLKVDKAKVRTVLEELAFAAHRSQPDLTGTADLSEKELAYQLFQLSSNPGVDIRQLVEYLRDRAGLLHPCGVGVYTFPHRSFQEYLAACHLTDEDYPEQIAELVTFGASY